MTAGIDFINSSRDGFQQADTNYENVTRSFRVFRMQAVFHVVLLLSLRIISSGYIIMWAWGLSESRADMVLAWQPMFAFVLVHECFSIRGAEYYMQLQRY